MARLSKGLVLLFVATAAFCHLERTYSQKFFDRSGDARWIWARFPMSSNEPVAFFAARDVTLPAGRVFTHLQVCGDPEYTLWVNGRRIASRRVRGQQRVLDVFDVSDLVQTGRNRMVVAVRAPQGFGGLIASMDLGPEKAGWLVTDEQWKIYRRWSPELLDRDLPDQAQPPMIVGEPPAGSWDYLQAASRTLEAPGESVLQPLRSWRAVGLVPAIRTSEGIAIAVNDRLEGTVFDFGFTRGRVRLSVEHPRFSSGVIRMRLANEAAELAREDWNLRPVVFGPGERVVTTAEESSFRYVMVFGKNVRAEVVQPVEAPASASAGAQ